MKHSLFQGILEKEWNRDVIGNPMYKVSTKLKGLKIPLRKLNKEFCSNITVKVLEAKEELHAIQRFLKQHSSDIEAGRKEKEMAIRYGDLCRDDESFYKQKSRVTRLQQGDRNIGYFHKKMVGNRSRSRIVSICRELIKKRRLRRRC